MKSSSLAIIAKIFAIFAVILASACGGGVYNTVGTTQKITTSQSSYTMGVGQIETIVVYGVYDTRNLQATAEPSTVCSVAGKTENVFHIAGVTAGKCSLLVKEGSQTVKVEMEVFRAVQAPLMTTNSGFNFPAGQSGTAIIYGGSTNGQLKAYSSDTSVCSSEMDSGNTLTVKGLSPGYCKVTVIKEGNEAFYPRNIVVGGYISVPAEKLEQEVLVPSTTKLSWAFVSEPVYTAAIVSVRGGSGAGAVSATTSDKDICTADALYSASKEARYGEYAVTISGSAKPGTCVVTVTKAGDYVYNPTSVTIEVVITDVIVTPTPVAPEVPQ